MRCWNRLALLVVIAWLPGCLKFGARTEETVSSRLVMGQLDQGILQKTQQTLIRIGDREYIASVLTNVFGPTANGAVMDNILRKPAQFGGPCDLMSESAKQNADCVLSDVGAATVPSVTAAREALRTQACDRIVQDDAAIRFAAAQARDRPDGGFVQSETPSLADIKAAYEIFVPGRALPDDIASSIKTGVVDGARANGGTPTESWRFLFLTLCLSPEWQIL